MHEQEHAPTVSMHDLSSLLIPLLKGVIYREADVALWGLPAILFVIGLPFFAVGVFFVSTVDFSGGRLSKRT